MYTKIEARYWRNREIRRLSFEAKSLLIYLMTNEQRNMLGLYYMPNDFIAHDTGLSIEKVGEIMRELSGAELVYRDDDSGVIFIPEFLDHNPLENKKQAQSAAKKLKNVPRGPMDEKLFERLAGGENRFFEVVILESGVFCEKSVYPIPQSEPNSKLLEDTLSRSSVTTGGYPIPQSEPNSNQLEDTLCDKEEEKEEEELFHKIFEKVE